MSALTQKEADAVAFKKAAEIINDLDYYKLADAPIDDYLLVEHAQARVVRILKEWNVYISKVK